MFKTILTVSLVLLFTTSTYLVQEAEAHHTPNHSGNPNCSVANMVDTFSVELASSKVVRLNWALPNCDNIFYVERNIDGAGWVLYFTADLQFSHEFIDKDDRQSHWFYLDDSLVGGAYHEYRIMGGVKPNKLASSYSPVVGVGVPPATVIDQVSSTLNVDTSGNGNLAYDIIPIAYEDLPLAPTNAFLEKNHWLQKLLDFDIISMLIGWILPYADSEFSTLWESSLDPQNEATLFYVEPMPTPISIGGICIFDTSVYFIQNQTGGQTIDFTVTLMDYANIIHQQTFKSEMADRVHVRNFVLDEIEANSIADYSNIFVQLNVNGNPDGDPRSLIIKDVIFSVPEDQTVCRT